jgi:acylphosphatase
MKKRIHVVFNGRVQGVGFRFTAESIADSLGVGGWVKNIPGGGVEVLAEGPEEILKDFIFQLETRFAGYIKDKDVLWERDTGEFKEFGVKF